jgi:hypothetical protein
MPYLVAIALLAAPAAHAEEVLLIDPSGGIDSFDLQQALLALGTFDAVDVWNSGLSNPTLAHIARYEGVLVLANSWHVDSVGLGEKIADYVDAGGTLVDTGKNLYWLSYGYSFGRLDNYLALDGGNSFLSYQSLTWSVPGHPFAAGVNTTYIPTNALFDGVVVPGATLVATWAGGQPAVATWAPTNAGAVTSVGFFPGGLTASPYGIDYSQTDEEVLLANTLTGGGVGFAGFSSGVCPGLATLEAVNGTDNGPLAVVSGTGPGSFVVPGGPCAGTTLPITGARLRLMTTFDPLGNWSITRTFNNPNVCGASVVFLDLTTCTVAQTTVP